MKEIKKVIFEDVSVCPECKEEFFGEGGAVDGVQYCGKCFPIKRAASKKVCEGCGEEFFEVQMKRHDKLPYCKACYDEIRLAKVSGRKKSTKDFEPLTTMPSSLAVTIEAPALADAITRSMSQVFANPIRIEFAPVKLELVGGGAITLPVQIPVPEPAPSAVPVSPPSTNPRPTTPTRILTHGRPYVEASILRVMGAKRRKWRPSELASELRLLDQPVVVTEEEVAQALEKLACHVPEANFEDQVVKLSTRFIRRDLFVVEDEVDFVDLIILKILNVAGKAGVPATVIHAAAELLNLIPAALPTVLNHLRALKSPGWELVEKIGMNMRDNYAITAKGIGLLADAEDAALGGFTGELRERLERIGVFTTASALAEKADILLAKVSDILLRHATKADQTLMVAHMEKNLEPAIARANSRKIAALKAFGL
jgi:hypothetical protein